MPSYFFNELNGFSILALFILREVDHQEFACRLQKGIDVTGERSGISPEADSEMHHLFRSDPIRPFQSLLL